VSTTSSGKSDRSSSDKRYPEVSGLLSLDGRSADKDVNYYCIDDNYINDFSPILNDKSDKRIRL
jgi:hypothetical protein